MGRIATIVEGHGEREAVPILIRRIAEAIALGPPPDLPRPIRVRRQRFLKEGELERSVELAARQAGLGGQILILLDADDDCPADLAPRILARARAVRGDLRIRVVLAKREYEAWFLAAAESIAGNRGISSGVTAPVDPEGIRDPKRWLRDRMAAGRTYSETVDQPAITALFDLQAARRAPSFDKMWREMEDALR